MNTETFFIVIILAVGGCSAIVLTQHAIREKGTALANSHWICTGSNFN